MKLQVKAVCANIKYHDSDINQYQENGLLFKKWGPFFSALKNKEGSHQCKNPEFTGAQPF